MAMSIAYRLQNYIARQGIDYDLIMHAHTNSSKETVEAAQVPGEQLAKAVILEDEEGYVMAVVPATHNIKLGRLRKQLKRELRLAMERDFSGLFNDCEVGAIPPVGMVYGMPTVVDDALAEKHDIYLESGDHEGLIHLRGDAFQSFFATAKRGRFSARSRRISPHAGARS
jgi:Ala-tRNA(Pro) deacylase